jgi:general secretion pathway protein D
MRPVVVRDTSQTDELSMDRYDLMRLKQEAAQPRNSVLVPINQAPVLPTLAPRTPPAPTPSGPPVPAEAAPPNAR